MVEPISPAVSVREKKIPAEERVAFVAEYRQMRSEIAQREKLYKYTEWLFAPNAGHNPVPELDGSPPISYEELLGRGGYFSPDYKGHGHFDQIEAAKKGLKEYYLQTAQMKIDLGKRVAGSGGEPTPMEVVKSVISSWMPKGKEQSA